MARAMAPRIRRLVSRCLVLAAAAAAARTPLGAAEDPPLAKLERPPSKVSFFRQVRPIFQAECQGCHQPAKAGGKFVITDYSELQKGGKSQSETPILVAGKPDESLLFQAITPQEGKPPEMPKRSDPLSKERVELIRRWILDGASDDTPMAVKSLISMDAPPVYESPPVVTAVDHSPDGQFLAVSGYHEVLIHKADGTGLVARLVGLSERIESVSFSPDGKLLAVAGGSPGRMGEVQVWELDGKKLALSQPFTYDTIYGVSWSHDGKLVGFGCADNTLRAIEASTGKQVLFQGAHNDWVLDTVFSKDSSHLVSVSRDRSMKLIQVATQQFIDNITSITPGALKGGLMSVDRHPSKDELLAGGADGIPKIFRMHREKKRVIGDDFNLIRQFEPLPGRIFAVEFSRDGERIAVGASADGQGEVRVYQAADGKRLGSFKPASPIYTVSFGPDGKTVAAGGFDGFVRIIDAEQGTVALEFMPAPIAGGSKFPRRF